MKLSILLFASASQAAILQLCSGSHGEDANGKSYTGNVFTLSFDQVDNSEAGSICGKYKSWIQSLAAENGIRVGAVNCATKPGVEMDIKVSLDKQSPGLQESVLMNAAQRAFQSFGKAVSCSCHAC